MTYDSGIAKRKITRKVLSGWYNSNFGRRSSQASINRRTWVKVFVMRNGQRILWCLVILASAAVAFGQEPSLGDVARQQRKKQAAKPANAATKIVTNEDMPARPVSEDDVTKDAAEEKHEGSPERDNSESSQPGNRRSAEEWKAQILTQKRAVTANQRQVEEFRASIHFVEANRYSNGVQYNERQRRRQFQLEQMETQLQQQKEHLARMQEAARKAGFGNSVSDPTE
jgi:hypothetical protein